MNRFVCFASLLASAVVMASCGHQAASVVPSTAFAHDRSGVYALAGNASSLHFGSYSYSHLRHLFAVHGAERRCDGGCRDSLGYDGSTGNGTPDGTGEF